MLRARNRIGFGISTAQSLMLPSAACIAMPGDNIVGQFEITGRSVSSIVPVRVCALAQLAPSGVNYFKRAVVRAAVLAWLAVFDVCANGLNNGAALHSFADGLRLQDFVDRADKCGVGVRQLKHICQT